MKTATKTVSVIIAAYNVERYIERAIQSALSQRDVMEEVIVVDDVSTDRTWDIISKMTDLRIKRLRSDQNRGPAYARNAALDVAAGKWIAILDGDDAFVEGRLARCLRLAEEQKADIVVDNLRAIRESDNTEKPMFNPARFARMKQLDLARFIKGNQCFLGGGEALGYLKPILSASFLRKHSLRYDPDIHIGEDYMMMAQALACGAVCVVDPHQGYNYTVRTGSISHRLSLDNIDRIAKADKKLLANVSLDPKAAAAQKNRTYRLNEARDFTFLVDDIKNRNLASTFKVVLSRPTVLRHLWRPVWARIQSNIKWMKTRFNSADNQVK
jgi:succinoglycan biosynthesis protein ExoO